MPERRLLIKEMWNDFNSHQPQRSVEQRRFTEMFFYAGVIAMYEFFSEHDATPELVEQMSQEIHDYVMVLATT